MRYLLTIEYDGLKLKGFQRLSHTSETVQGMTEEALFIVLGRHIKISGSGRTDAGVSALGQMATFDYDGELSESFISDVNEHLPENIRIKKAACVADNFHARYSAVSKTYRYRLYDGEVRDVFGIKHYYDVGHRLDEARLLRACELLSGTHDYKGFSSDRERKDTFRCVCISYERKGNYIDLYFKGNGFLYNMVRILAGTILGYENGSISEKTINEVWRLGDRKNAGITLPPNALTLMSVEY